MHKRLRTEKQITADLLLGSASMAPVITRVALCRHIDRTRLNTENILRHSARCKALSSVDWSYGVEVYDSCDHNATLSRSVAELNWCSQTDSRK